MKRFIAAAFALACFSGPVRGAYDEEGLSEAALSTDTVKAADEEEDQPFVQESDEDLAAFVADYIRRDTGLKGAFLLEDAAAKKILKLQLVSVEPTAKAAAGSEKTVTTVMRDASGKKFTVNFHLQAGPWGGLDIFKIELSRSAAGGKTGK